MVPPHGIPLAAHIISSFYGDLCCKECECLLRGGTLTLAQIISFTELSRDNVVNCLRVLIHQNCVQAFTIPQEGAFAIEVHLHSTAAPSSLPRRKGSQVSATTSILLPHVAGVHL